MAIGVWKHAMFVAVIGCVAASSSVRAQDATSPQSGDIFVGGASSTAFGVSVGGIFLVRGGAATLYCAPPSSSVFDQDFWNVPNSLIVDSQGRIVFLAPLGAYWQQGARRR